MKRIGVKRVYNKKAWECRKWVYRVVLFISFPIWFPLYLLTILGNSAEGLLDFFDSLVDKILDIVTPSFGGVDNKKR